MTRLYRSEDEEALDILSREIRNQRDYVKLLTKAHDAILLKYEELDVQLMSYLESLECHDRCDEFCKFHCYNKDGELICALKLVADNA